MRREIVDTLSVLLARFAEAVDACSEKILELQDAAGANFHVLAWD